MTTRSELALHPLEDLVRYAGPGQEEALASVMRRLSLLWGRLRGKGKAKTLPPDKAAAQEKDDKS